MYDLAFGIANMQTQKIAVVIGGSGGIGSALMQALSEEGFFAVSVSRSGHIHCDLSSYESIQEAILLICNRFEKIDLLIHAAGIAIYEPLLELKHKTIESGFMINIMAPILITQGLLRKMQHAGALVLTIGSGAGVIPMAGRSMYCATKFGLRGFSLSMSKELQGQFPKFSLLSLGSTFTDFGPLSLEDRERLAKNGKKYLSVEQVVSVCIQIITQDSSKVQDEVELYPEGYGEK